MIVAISRPDVATAPPIRNSPVRVLHTETRGPRIDRALDLALTKTCRPTEAAESGHHARSGPGCVRVSCQHRMGVIESVKASALNPDAFKRQNPNG